MGCSCAIIRVPDEKRKRSIRSIVSNGCSLEIEGVYMCGFKCEILKMAGGGRRSLIVTQEHRLEHRNSHHVWRIINLFNNIFIGLLLCFRECQVLG